MAEARGHVAKAGSGTPKQEPWQLREIRTEIFIDPADYQAGLGCAGFEAFLACAGRFKARLRYVELCQLSLLHVQENLARVAYLKMAPKRAFITFPTNGDSSMIWAGVRLRPGDIVFHGLGDQMYQRTTGPGRWGVIALAPASLVAYGQVLAECDLVPPPAGEIIRPSLSAAGRLRHLHRLACRLAETKPDSVAHPEVAKALDQDLIHALVICLATGDVLADTPPHRRHTGIMTQFEELLAANLDSPVPMPRLCRALGVSTRSLQLCCAEFLGMGANRYSRLRRMHAAHSALRRAGPEIRSVAEVARRHGFSELGRFAVNYRSLFGESPSDTVRHRLGRSRSHHVAVFA
jgi:AraC-like DNA-binding protein